MSHFHSQAGVFFCLFFRRRIFFYKIFISSYHVLLSTMGPLSCKFSNRNLSCSVTPIRATRPPSNPATPDILLQRPEACFQSFYPGLCQMLPGSLACPTPPGVHLKKLPDNSQPFKRFFFFRLTSQVLSGGNYSLTRPGELSPNVKFKLSNQKSVTDSSAFQQFVHPELNKSPAL